MATLILCRFGEFIIAGALVSTFSPWHVLLITLMVSERQIFYAISIWRNTAEFVHGGVDCHTS